jgi:hypothetical protein
MSGENFGGASASSSSVGGEVIQQRDRYSLKRVKGFPPPELRSE